METEHKESLSRQYKSEVNSLVQKAGALLRSPYGLWFLGGFSFADAALGLPVTMDPFLIAYIVSNRKKAWWGFMIVVAASVLGGVFAYFFASYVIKDILTVLAPDVHHTMMLLSHQLNQSPILFSLIIAFSPIPYTIFAVAAGALKINIFAFIVGSILGRTVRYGMIAYPTYVFGSRAVEAAKRNRVLVATVVLIALVVYALIIFRHFH